MTKKISGIIAYTTAHKGEHVDGSKKWSKDCWLWSDSQPACDNAVDGGHKVYKLTLQVVKEEVIGDYTNLLSEDNGIKVKCPGCANREWEKYVGPDNKVMLVCVSCGFILGHG